MGLCHDTAWARQLGRRRGRWGASVGAGLAGGSPGSKRARRALGALACWASGRRLAAGVGVQAGARQAERDRRSALQAERAAAGAGGTQQARGNGMDVRGRAAGAGRGARGDRLGGLCASSVRSWARLGVLVHLTQFLAWFDSVFFPSHQMNTVHCKINFFEKKNILNLIKIN